MCIYCRRLGVDIGPIIKSSLYSMIRVPSSQLKLRYEMKQRVRGGPHHMPHRCWALMLYTLKVCFCKQSNSWNKQDPKCSARTSIARFI